MYFGPTLASLWTISGVVLWLWVFSIVLLYSKLQIQQYHMSWYMNCSNINFIFTAESPLFSLHVHTAPNDIALYGISVRTYSQKIMVQGISQLYKAIIRLAGWANCENIPSKSKTEFILAYLIIFVIHLNWLYYIMVTVSLKVN